MSTTTPEKPTSTNNAISSQGASKLIHNVSLAVLIVCPIIIALPPRKFDVYTVALLSGTALGANQVTREYTGRSILTRVQGFGEHKLPEKARETQRRLQEERALQIASRGGGLEKDRESGEVLQALRSQNHPQLYPQSQQTEDKKKEKGIIGKLWMGDEPENWKQKRDEREKEALEEGRGYGGLILDQIWEVWNQGRKKDEEVLTAKKEGNTKE